MGSRNSWRKVWDGIRARAGKTLSRDQSRRHNKLRSLTLEFLEQRAMMTTAPWDCYPHLPDHPLQECDCGCKCDDASKQDGLVGSATTSQKLTQDGSVTSTHHSNDNPHPVITAELEIPELDGRTIQDIEITVTLSASGNSIDGAAISSPYSITSPTSYFAPTWASDSQEAGAIGEGDVIILPVQMLVDPTRESQDYHWEASVVIHFTDLSTPYIIDSTLDGHAIVSGDLFVQNEKTSNFGNKATLNGLDRLIVSYAHIEWLQGNGDYYTFDRNDSYGTDPDGYHREAGDLSFAKVEFDDEAGVYHVTTQDRQVLEFPLPEETEDYEAAGSSTLLLASRKAANGDQTDYTYDEHGRLSSISDPAGRVTTFNYSGHTRANGEDPADWAGTLTVTDPAGRATVETFDSEDRIVSVIYPNPDGSGSGPYGIAYTYYSGTTSIETINHIVTVDGEGDPDVVYTTTLHYAHVYQIATMTHPNGSVEHFQAAQSVGLLEIDPATGAIDDTTGYDSSHLAGLHTIEDRVAKQWKVDGSEEEDVSIRRMDRYGHTVNQSTDAFTQTTYQRDAEGRAEFSAANGDVEDTDNRVAYSYGTTVGDADYGQLNSETGVGTWTYDSFGPNDQPLVESFIDIRGEVTHYSYAFDENGDLSVMTTRQVVGMDDNSSSEHDDLTTTNAYTNLEVGDGKVMHGLLATTVDPRGIKTEYLYYDSGIKLGWISEIRYDVDTPEGEPETYVHHELFDYDDAGNVTSITDENGTTTMEYDNWNRLVAQTDPDPDGGVGPLPSQALIFHYDGLKRLIEQDESTTATGAPVLVATFEYAVNTTDHTSTQTQYTYGHTGTAGQIVSVKVFDHEGNLIDQYDPDPTGGTGLTGPHTRYQYDALNRLISVTGPYLDSEGDAAAPVTTYAYDEAGRTRVVAHSVASNGNVDNHIPVANFTNTTFNVSSSATQLSIHLFGITNGGFTDEEDASSSLRYSVNAVSKPALFQSLTFNADNPRTLVIDLADGQTTPSSTDAWVEIKATDSAGASTTQKFYVHRPSTTAPSQEAVTGGYRVVDATPGNNVLGAVDAVTLTFNREIDSNILQNEGAFRLTDPDNATIVSSSGLTIRQISQRQIQVSFSSQSAVGEYQLRFNPFASGLTFDQDRDGTDDCDQFAAAIFHIAASPNRAFVATKFDYDSLNRVTQIETRTAEEIEEDGGLKTGYMYSGNDVYVTDPLYNVTTYKYNPLGQLIEVDLPEIGSGSSSVAGTPKNLYGYDRSGNLQSTRVYTDDTRYRETFRHYDGLNRLTDLGEANPETGDAVEIDGESITFLGPHTHYNYHSDGTISSIVDAGGHTTVYA